MLCFVGHQFCTMLFVGLDFFEISVKHIGFVLYYYYYYFWFFCHRHRWCCWDISFCLNPSCVIKVPLLCISSPSLSENLSCPLMGVCWWVWLIVGLFVFWFLFGVYEVILFLPAVTHLTIVWCFAVRLQKKKKEESKKKKKRFLFSHLPVRQFLNKTVQLAAALSWCRFRKSCRAFVLQGF